MLDASLAALRAVNGKLNAITDFYEGDLLEKSVAGAGDGPFHGIPFVVKHSWRTAPARRLQLGSRFFAKEAVGRS